jgi:hypothetical protein
MKLKHLILSFGFALSFVPVDSVCQTQSSDLHFDFYGETIDLQFDRSSFINFTGPLSDQSLHSFYDTISLINYRQFINSLITYKEKLKLDDWLYYQLIRKTAQQISPKAENYHRYTLYKWFFLTQSGYDATLKTNGEKLLFYVQSDENIYNIPYYTKNDKQYVCLNYHDYGNNIDFLKETFSGNILSRPTAKQKFSYKVTRLPGFHPGDYKEKELQFRYNENDFHFKVKLNLQVKNIFANYPVVDYESYFNIPMSNETYSSLIPLLKKNLKGLNIKNGVDYLVHFTRYAFRFQPDSVVFGNEKRFSPEQTLLYDQSDCEDRAALFFFLVKEIYDLPMIVLSFPEHVTIAVKFDKPVGIPIIYNGMRYSVCEPTPQKVDLNLGQLPPTLAKTPYEIAYAYMPNIKLVKK